MKKLTLTLLALLAVICVYAKDVNISGTVIGAADGDPLIGVSVSVKGQKTGVTTDIDGNFSILAPEGSKLVFNYIGC